ncbi:hypothetical protein D3C73_1594700 [compost metagenome]
MVFVEGLAHQILGVAADLVHRTVAKQAVAIAALDFQIDHAATHRIQVEGFVEQANERADGARGVVVLGLAQ